MTKIKLICPQCSKGFEREIRQVNRNKKRASSNFCSNTCKTLFLTLPIYTCLQCNKGFEPVERKQKFCSQTCSAIYNNTHKTMGNRRSKLELYLEERLKSIYPFEIKFNSKEEINSELDIYIPSLKLAFELNGIYHYEPIHGQDKLNQIQNNDDRKFQACLEKGIELCIVDTSKEIYFKENKSLKFLEKIVNTINSKLVAEAGPAPAISWL